MADGRDISHWTTEQRMNWIMDHLTESPHYGPAFDRMGVGWGSGGEFTLTPPEGGYVRGDIFDGEMCVDGHYGESTLHDLWVIQSGINHCYMLIIIQKKLPMEHGK